MDKKGLTREQVLNVIEKISKPEESKHTDFEEKTFRGAVSYAWSQLNFADTPSMTVLEDFLIEIIEERYKLKNNKDNRNALKHDCSLLMFGLLQGYYHMDIKTGNYLSLQSRYDKYLNYSDYINIKYPGEGSYKAIQKRDKLNTKRKKNAQSRPLNTLTRTATDCKKELSDFLYKSLTDESYKAYIHEYNPKHEKLRPFNLPLPIFTLENFPLEEPPLNESHFPSATTIDPKDLDTLNKHTETTQKMDDFQSNGTGDVTKFKKPNEDNEMAGTRSEEADEDTVSPVNNDAQDTKGGFLFWKYLKIPQSKKIENYIIIMLVVTFCIISLKLVCNQKQYDSSKERASTDSISEENGIPEIKSIELKPKYLILAPGESRELEVKINPPSVGVKELDYTSSDPFVASAGKNTITANSIWIEEANHQTVITAQGGGVAQGKAFIEVEKQEDTEYMIGSGKNDTVSDGDIADFQLGE